MPTVRRRCTAAATRTVRGLVVGNIEEDPSVDEVGEDPGVSKDVDEVREDLGVGKEEYLGCSKEKEAGED